MPDRPPSGKRDRDKIISRYTSQLSSAVAKNYRAGNNTPSATNSSASSRNTQFFIRVDHKQQRSSRANRNSEVGDNWSTGAGRPVQRRRAQSARARLGAGPGAAPRRHGAKPERHSAQVRWETAPPDGSPGPGSRRRGTATGQEHGVGRGGRLGSEAGLEPSVKGCGGRLSRSESDVSRIGKPLKSCLKSSAQSVNMGSGTRRTLTSPVRATRAAPARATRGADSDLTDEALGVIVDNEDTDDDDDGGGDDGGDDDGSCSQKKEDAEELSLPLPLSLRTLAHWWTPDIPPRYLGVDHLRCWVFLPSMVDDYDDLPVVPAKVTDPGEELPYKEIIREPAPWAPKKYRHPWTKRPLDTPSCQNGAGAVSPIKVTTADGRLMHETSSGRRTVAVVRGEILELEQLMRGVGSAGGSSLVVRYQHEINQLQTMVARTLPRVEQLERRTREKQKALETKITDHFGLRKFCRNHDEVMQQIRVQHARCIRELAILERGVRLHTDPNHAYFQKWHQKHVQDQAGEPVTS